MAKILCVTEEDTRTNLVHALWRYVKKRKLHDPDDITQVRFDSDELCRFFRPSTVATAALPAALDRHIVPANSVRIKYRLSFAPSIAADVFELGVQGIHKKPLTSLDGMEERTVSEIDSEILNGLDKLLGENCRKHDFFAGLAEDPAGFARRALLSQAIDGHAVRRAALGKNRAALMTRTLRRPDLWALDLSGHVGLYLAKHQPAGRPALAESGGGGERPQRAPRGGNEGGADAAARRAYADAHAEHAARLATAGGGGEADGGNGGGGMRYPPADGNGRPVADDGFSGPPQGLRGPRGPPQHLTSAAHLNPPPRQQGTPPAGSSGPPGGGGGGQGGFSMEQTLARALARDPGRVSQMDRQQVRPDGSAAGGGAWQGGHDRGGLPYGGRDGSSQQQQQQRGPLEHRAPQDASGMGPSFRLQGHGGPPPTAPPQPPAGSHRQPGYGPLAGDYSEDPGGAGDGFYVPRKRPRPPPPSADGGYLQHEALAAADESAGPRRTGSGMAGGPPQHALGHLPDVPQHRAQYGPAQTGSTPGGAGLGLGAGGSFGQIGGLVGAGGGGVGISSAMDAEHVQQREAMRQAHNQQKRALHALLQPPLLSSGAPPPPPHHPHPHHHQQQQHISRALSSAAGLDSILAAPPQLAAAAAAAAAAAGLQQGPLWAAAGLPQMPPPDGTDPGRGGGMRFPGM